MHADYIFKSIIDTSFYLQVVCSCSIKLSAAASNIYRINLQLVSMPHMNGDVNTILVVLGKGLNDSHRSLSEIEVCHRKAAN